MAKLSQCGAMNGYISTVDLSIHLLDSLYSFRLRLRVSTVRKTRSAERGPELCLLHHFFLESKAPAAICFLYRFKHRFSGRLFRILPWTYLGGGASLKTSPQSGARLTSWPYMRMLWIDRIARPWTRVISCMWFKLSSIHTFSWNRHTHNDARQLVAAGLMVTTQRHP